MWRPSPCQGIDETPQTQKLRSIIVMSKQNKNPRGRVGSRLTNECREVLCAKGMTPCALVLDALYHVGVIPDTEHSVTDVLEKLSVLSISPDLIRRALKYPLFRTTRYAATAGRDVAIVCVPSPAQVSLYFRLSPAGHGDDLPEWAYGTPKAYRKALHFCIIRRYTKKNTGELRKSVEWFAKRLNVSKRTIRRYNAELKAAGLIDYWQNLTAEHINPLDVYWAFPRERSFKCWMRGTNPAGQTFDFPGIRELACKLSAAGWSLMKMRQHNNSYVALGV